MIASMMSRGKNFNKLTYLINNQFSSTYQIIDSKNSHLLFLKDPSATLPFMSEVTLESGQKGVVLKIGQESITVVGMYNKMEVSNSIQVVKCEKIKELCSNFSAQPNFVYNIEGKQITNKFEAISNR